MIRSLSNLQAGMITKDSIEQAYCFFHQKWRIYSYSTDEAQKAALAKQIDDWTKTAARYRSEPETGEGSEQLAARAKEAEHARDLAMARYHHYEVASAAFQIGIVLASATIITGMVALAWISGALALAGLAFTAIGLFAPHAVHLM